MIIIIIRLMVWMIIIIVIIIIIIIVIMIFSSLLSSSLLFFSLLFCFVMFYSVLLRSVLFSVLIPLLCPPSLRYRLFFSFPLLFSFTYLPFFLILSSPLHSTPFLFFPLLSPSLVAGYAEPCWRWRHPQEHPNMPLLDCSE